jgi:rhomboid protease GluP
LALGLLSPIVSNACHVGGLLGGLMLGWFLPSALLTGRRAVGARHLTRIQTALAAAALLGAAVFFLPHLN